MHIGRNEAFSLLHCTALHLLDLVARVGDALRDALVGADGSSKLSVVLNNQLIQIMITLLVCFFQATLLIFPVLNIITGGQSPKKRRKKAIEEMASQHRRPPSWKGATTLLFLIIH